MTTITVTPVIGKILNLLVDSLTSEMLADGTLSDGDYISSNPDENNSEVFVAMLVISWLRKKIISMLPGWLASEAVQFEDQFGPMPDGKVVDAYIEIGNWDEEEDQCPWEASVSLLAGPDGNVWICVGSVDEMPDEEI